MSNLPNPHDALFKKLLSDVSIARDFLTIHLPNNLKKYCDLSTLEIASGSFVEDDLHQHFSDILYALNIAGRIGYIYIVVEHISQAHLLTPFQVLRYQIAAMKQHIDQGSQRLPVVIPLLFYRGKASPYPEPTDVFDCFEHPDLAREVFLKPLKLIDLSMIPDEELRTHKSVALLELLQKHMLGRDIMELAHYLVDQLLYKPLPVDQFRSVLEYVQSVGKCADQKAFIRFLEQSNVDPEYKKAMSTVAEYLRQEGMQQGLLQGMQASHADALAFGERRAKLKAARKMLDAGSPIEFVKLVTELEEKDLATPLSETD